MSAKYQLWQLDNILEPGQLYNGYDKLYVPRIGHTTGDLDIHEVALNSAGEVIFISTLLNCLATLSDRHSCAPLWKPKFISQIVTEDRCHLNGLAVVDGQPRFVTACSRSDIIDGWRTCRRDGGVVIDVPSNEIVCAGLSMPHSPRFYHGKLWLHNSGTGFFGYADLLSGKFEPVAFCPGYLRGLTFWKDYAIVGLSKPRRDKSFSELPLDDELTAKNYQPWCGLMAIELNTGSIAGWLRFEGIITELYDVQAIPGVSRPMALGFQDDEIERRLTFDTSRLLSESKGILRSQAEPGNANHEAEPRACDIVNEAEPLKKGSQAETGNQIIAAETGNQIIAAETGNQLKEGFPGGAWEPDNSGGDWEPDNSGGDRKPNNKLPMLFPLIVYHFLESRARNWQLLSVTPLQ